jgi:hypothetical protein
MTNAVTQKNDTVSLLVNDSVEISKDAIEKLKNLLNVTSQNSVNSNNISCNVNQQLFVFIF